MTTTDLSTTHTLSTTQADLVYDVHGPLPTADGDRPLLMIGHPMAAAGFATLVSLLPDRTSVTYDPRGIGRSTRRDGRSDHTPEQNAQDVHDIITCLGGGPVDLFASSGGAVTALALVAAHPDDVRVLVAHEPPLLALLPDADRALAAERAVHTAYRERGWGAGMAAFIALTSWQGEFDEEPTVIAAADPTQFGLPAADDGSRDDPLLSGSSAAVTSFRPDFAALAAAPTSVLLAAGKESEGTVTWRTTVAASQALGRPLTVFPSHHGGFLGEESGYAGQPEAFAATLREVLADAPQPPRW